MATILQTKNLTKNYGKNRGIVDVNLEIEQGEIFGFIGPNGAGKSTAIRTLLGLIKPTSGSATIFGKDIVHSGPSIREHIGYLPSEVFYYDTMHAKDLLNYSASFYQQPRQKMQARIKELAGLLNLDLNRKIDDLSYGNKKKVGIIQGLLHSPKLLILDEPTGGLDPLMQQTFFDLLRAENEKGATVLFSSHILSEVQKICHRVAIIKEGRLIKVEKMADLRSNNYVKCRFETNEAFDANGLDLPGISNLQTNGSSVSFLFRGNINTVTAYFATLSLKNLWLEEPDLEEIFMHYYQKSNKA